MREEQDEAERRREIPEYYTEWRVLKPEEEHELLGTRGEYIPKSVTMKHTLYSREWGCEEVVEPRRGLRELFKGQEAFLEADSNP